MSLNNDISPLPPVAKMRVGGVDYYRFVALMTIFLQHTPGIYLTPTVLHYFLTFNVLAVIMGSALGSRLSTTSRSYTTYMWMKIKAILFPSYVYIFGAHLFQRTIGFPITPLPSGFGILNFRFSYFWFIRGYLLIYAFSPAIVRVNKNTRSHKKYFFKVFLINCTLEIFNYLLLDVFEVSSYVKSVFQYHFNSYCYFPVYYAVFYRLPDLTNSQYWAFFLLLLISLCGLLLKHFFLDNTSLNPHEHKEPMDSTYGLYGILCSMILYRGIPLMEKFFSLIALDVAAKFFSKHSLWIYLHHIAFIRPLFKMGLPTIVNYMIVVLCGAGVTKMQTTFVDRVASQIPNPEVARNLRIILG